MKLYYFPGACSLAPHIVSKEAGIDLELINTDIRAHKLEDGSDYFDINPKGCIPALALDDGQLLTEGPVVSQYLADLKPEAKLAPAAGTIERYRVQEWLGYINSDIHKLYTPLVRQAAEDIQRAAKESLNTRFIYVNNALKGKDFLVGEHFTIADAYMFVMILWANHLKLDISKFDALNAYFGRIVARPAVQAALKAEGLA
ncbi:glutathione transferase GstA [Pseudomaricurvus alcaniphilus]|uniref:glutathione transferase GstA n=1 Tax=Pseudomaricurvus alcaniphilus TaxID=1166482 RepID=UPI001408752F|nr:glutathione transferase GstA [Pseudomaricurvus alcaniphilus]NHN36519.1 glutathione transferase GstA [Pseudomaricurvus alcaniphilus]